MNLLTISIGQAGNQLNYELSKLIFKDENARKNYTTTYGNLFKNILIDSEAKVVLKYNKDQELSNFYNDSNIVINSSGRGNNWALGYSRDYKEKNKLCLVDEAYEKIRKMINKCDFLNGVMIFHSVNGGTGSGLGTRLIEMIREEFPVFYIFDCPILGFDSKINYV